jgi:hypothetical protein
MFHLWRISLARSIIILRLASRMSSIFSRNTLAEHGPTRFMLSMLAAISAVLTLSRLVGMVIVPVVWSFFECNSISILPMRPVFWSSLRSSLPENCAYNVWFFHYAFDFKSGVYNILYGKCLGCSRKCTPPIL